MQHSHQHRSLEGWVVPALILAFCGFAYWISTDFDRMPPILKRGIQPSDFPQLIAGLIAFLTMLMVWRDPVRVVDRVGGVTWASLLMMLVFAGLTTIDFFLALAVFAAGLALIWGERRLSILALVGFVVPVAVFFLFDSVFAIRFPRGALTSLWYG